MVTKRQIHGFARRIAAYCQPQRIILFGSYAYGQPTNDSDVDMLVVLPFRGECYLKAAEIKLGLNPEFPLDLLARTPAQLQKRLRLGDFFLREVTPKGIVLYEAIDERGSKRRRAISAPRCCSLVQGRSHITTRRHSTRSNAPKSILRPGYRKRQFPSRIPTIWKKIQSGSPRGLPEFQHHCLGAAGYFVWRQDPRPAGGPNELKDHQPQAGCAALDCSKGKLVAAAADRPGAEMGVENRPRSRIDTAKRIPPRRRAGGLGAMNRHRAPQGPVHLPERTAIECQGGDFRIGRAGRRRSPAL